MSDENHAPLYPDVDMKKLGERIKQIRESTPCAPKSGSSITYMSGKEFGIAVGISDSSAQTIISDMENGKKASPNIATLLNIAHIGGKSLEWLLYGDNAPAPIKRDAPDTSQTSDETPIQNDRPFDVNDLFRAIIDTADILHTRIWSAVSNHNIEGPLWRDYWACIAIPLYTYKDDYLEKTPSDYWGLSSRASQFTTHFLAQLPSFLAYHRRNPDVSIIAAKEEMLRKVPRGPLSGLWESDLNDQDLPPFEICPPDPAYFVDLNESFEPKTPYIPMF